VLKGSGHDILSTHSGYIIQKSTLKERVFKVYHTTEQTEDELTTIVNFGGTVVDVFVWHKVYGKMTAPLNIFSALHIKQFIEGVRSGKSTELMNITGGYHYHTVRAESEEILDRIGQALINKNYIAPEI
jgi:transcriptional regulator of NAD metabolism